MKPNAPVSRKDIAALTGRTVRTVRSWSQRAEGSRYPFPAPDWIDGNGTLLWKWQHVERYLIRRGLIPLTLPEVAALLGLSEARTFEASRLGGIPAADFEREGTPRWYYPPLRCALVADPWARGYMTGAISWERWREHMHAAAD